MTRYAYSASSNWLNSADSTVRDRYLDSARSHAENAADQAERSVKAVGYAGRHELNILRREGEGWMEKAQERVGRTGGGGSDGGWPKTEKKDWQAFKPLVLKSQQQAHAAAQRAAQASGSGTSGESSHMLDGFYAVGHHQHGRSTGVGSSSSTGRGRGGEGGGESWVDELKKHPGDMAAIALADAALVTTGYEIGKHLEKKKSRTRSRSRSRSRRGTGVYQPDF